MITIAIIIRQSGAKTQVLFGNEFLLFFYQWSQKQKLRIGMKETFRFIVTMYCLLYTTPKKGYCLSLTSKSFI